MKLTNTRFIHLLTIFALVASAESILAQDDTNGQYPFIDAILNNSSTPTIQEVQLNAQLAPTVTLIATEPIRAFVDQSAQNETTIAQGDYIEVRPPNAWSFTDVVSNLGRPMTLIRLFTGQIIRVDVTSGVDPTAEPRRVYMNGSDFNKTQYSTPPSFDTADEGEEEDAPPTEAAFCAECAARNAQENTRNVVETVQTEFAVARSQITRRFTGRDTSLAADMRRTFNSYSHSQATNNMLSTADRFLRGPHYPDRRPYVVHGSRGQRGMTYCYRAVKNAMISSGVVRRTFAAGDASASNAGNQLAREGYINILTDPRYARFREQLRRNPNLAPRGAIMVYSGGRNNYGHVEIKEGEAGNGGYVSFSRTPRADYGMGGTAARPLIGVMVRI